MSEEYTGPAKQFGPARPAPTRRYRIEHRRGREVVWSATVENPEEALGCFLDALATDGHSEHKLRMSLQTWTLVLMKGGNAYSVLAPDLLSTTSISIIT